MALGARSQKIIGLLFGFFSWGMYFRSPKSPSKKSGFPGAFVPEKAHGEIVWRTRCPGSQGFRPPAM